MILDIADRARIHLAVANAAIQYRKTIDPIVCQKPFCDDEIAAYCLYIGSIEEGVDYTMKEICTATGISEGKLFKLAKLCRCSKRVNPANIVERFVRREAGLDHRFPSYKEIRNIQAVIKRFPPMMVQSLSPQTIVAAAIQICAPDLSPLEIGKTLGVNRKSLTQLVQNVAADAAEGRREGGGR